MNKRIYVGAGASALIAVVALATMVSGAIARSGATPLPASSCSAIQNPSGQYLLASDLPLEGSGRTQTSQMARAIKFILAQHHWKAGKYSLAYQSCDDATAQAGKWDSGKVSANGNAYAQNSSVIGVIGTFNSGAAEIMIPILNRAPKIPDQHIPSLRRTVIGSDHVSQRRFPCVRITIRTAGPSLFPPLVHSTLAYAQSGTAVLWLERADTDKCFWTGLNRGCAAQQRRTNPSIGTHAIW